MSTITSRTLLQVANQLRAGRHPLVAGRVGDLVMLQGQALSLPDALEHLGRSAFDVVLRINAADGLCVGHGQDRYETIAGSGLSDDDTAEDGGGGDEPERERRLRALREQVAAQEDPLVTIRRCLAQSDVSVIAIVEQTDITLQDPAHHEQPDRDRIAQLQLALREATRAGRYRNSCVLLTGNLASVPAVLLEGSEDIGVVDVECPTRAEQIAHLTSLLGSMHGVEHLHGDAARADIVAELAQLTEGEPLRWLEALAAFSAASSCTVLDPRTLVHEFRFGDRPDYWAHLLPQLSACRDAMAANVFGQGPAIDMVTSVLAAGALGLDLSGNPRGNEGQPRGVFFFLGTTGVGKTELAKTTSEVVFGDPEAYIRFDMSTFAQEHSAERLLGSPPGFVGHEQGGELTNAVRQRPNAVILLDEIEKAHPRVLDRLLSIIDDGRVTDAQGHVVHFSETIIVATSNIGGRDLVQRLIDGSEPLAYPEIRDILIESLRGLFSDINRIELFGRIEPGIVAFDVLRPDIAERIAHKVLCAAMFTNGPRLEIDSASTCAMVRDAMADPHQLVLGGRQIRNILQRHLRRLSCWVALEGHAGAEEVRVRFDTDQMYASVDNGVWTLVP